MEPLAQPVDIEQVKRAELDLILDRIRQPGSAEPAIWGVALSGGGIRSATFALGALQVLARSGLLRGFHYVSSISGGGYANAFLQGLIRRRGFAGAFGVLSSSVRDRAAQPSAPATDDPGDPQQPVLHLREYSNYLSPHTSALSGDTLGMLGTYVRNVLLVQIQLCALFLALTLLPLLLYPWLQRGAARWPSGFLLTAALLGVAAAVLLGWITTRANRVLQDGRPAGIGTPPSAQSRCDDDAARAGVAGAAVTDTREAPPPFAARAAALAILATAVATLLGAAGLWGINARYGPSAAGSGAPLNAFAAWASLDDHLGAAAAAFYFLAWMLWLAFDRCVAWRQRLGDSDDWRSPLMLHSLRFIVSTAAAAALGGCALVAARHIILSWQGAVGLWHAIIIGPTCLWAAVTFTGIVHLGLAGPALNDLQREVWARVGGRAAAAVILGVGFTLSLAIYGPWLLTYGLSFAQAKWRAVGWIGVIAWAVTSGSGILAAYSQKVGDPQSRSRLLDRLARIAPWVFLLGLTVLISYAGQSILAAVGWGPTPKDIDHMLYLAYLASGAVSHGGILLVVLAGAVVVWLIFGFAMELNEFSMNAFYRNRLVRCYLGASNAARRPEPITNFDPQDDLVLADVVEISRDAGLRPLFPLFGTALNMVAAKQLDWQDRKAASFGLTPGYCGYLPPPSHPNACPIGDKSAAVAGTFPARPVPVSAAAPAPVSSREILPDPVAVTLTLGSAIAISGAAVSPNMGYHSSAAVTFLLTLFDARLGWWLPNPTHARRKRTALPPFSGGWLVAELLGLTRDGGRHLYLSDGGHFENLGLYELVRRGCRFIVCVDASADADRDFADLGDAVQKCRVDFGVDIRIDVADLRVGANGLSARSCAVGTIAYADGREGVLLYMKPSVTGSEPTDVAHYARAHPSFPHEPTSDQYFDAAQFESYRRLGEHVATTAFASALERAAAISEATPQAALDVRDGPQKERILIELRHAWASPLDGVKNRFSTHADAMAQLFAKLRGTPALAVLDAQIYPSWIDLMPPVAELHMPRSSTPLARRTDLPARADFRTCFYFCQELIQLMEAVYHDIALEHAFDHPDNRGWMNMFRHWSWAPVFRVAWAVGAPTFGRRFVGFCELRLDLPRLNSAVGVAELPRLPGTSWKAHCDALADDGRINHVERGILLSEAIASGAGREALRVLVMRMEWASVLGRSAGDVADSTVAVAVLDGGTLRLLRVQDHLRRMGLGAEFMRRLASRIDAVEVRPGSYGEAGIATPREAAELNACFESRWRQALAELRGAGTAA